MYRPQDQLSQIINKQKAISRQASFQNNECLPGSRFKHPSKAVIVTAQHIALAPHRAHFALAVADGLEFATNLADMHVEAAVMGRITALQHMLIKEGLAQHFLAAAVQDVQQ